MRAPSYDADYGQFDEPIRSSTDGLRAVAIVGAVALIAAPALTSMLRRWRSRQDVAATQPAMDKTLQDTFPASDPPASRYFDIPENRQ